MKRAVRLRSLPLLAGTALLAAVPCPAQESTSDEPVQAAESLLRDARMQLEIGEFTNAREGLLDAIEVLEAAESVDPGLLIEALVDLGHAFTGEEAYVSAIEAFEEAGAISRREYGLYNEQMIDIVRMMQQSAGASGDAALYAEYGSEVQRLIWRSLEDTARSIGETHGYDSREYLEAKLELADWLASQRGSRRGPGLLAWSQEAREDYVDILRLIDEEFDDDPKLNIEVLRQMSENIGRVMLDSSGVQLSTAPIELIRAERMAKRLNESDPMLHASVLREMGDWRLDAGRLNSAQRVYREAWSVLERADDGAALRAALFREPEMLREVIPFDLGGLASDAPDAPLARAELEFTVNEEGRATIVHVVSAEPPWAGDAAVAVVEHSLFRPRFEEDRFVTAPGRIVWGFHYDPAAAAKHGLTGR